MLTCKCLNVGIESETNEFPTVTPCSLNLTFDDIKDLFFREELQRVENLNIRTVHSGLVQERIVGSWTITKCINCNMDTHAVNKQKEGTFGLVSAFLLPEESISALKNSNLFSTIFNIIVKQCEIDDKQFDDITGNSQQEKVIRGLKQIVSEALTKETAAAEERIRQFTEQQTQALDALRERALKEHRSLARAVLSNSNTSNLWTSPSSTNKPTSSPKTISKSAQTANMSAIKSSNPSLAPNSKRSSNTSIQKDPSAKRSPDSYLMTSVSLDAEGLFPFDGIDDDAYVPDDDEDPDDGLYNDDAVKDEGVDIPRSRTQMSVAKSLPMNIPVFMSSFHNHIHEDQDDTLPHTEDVQDIAASIKALAKSVHGDTVFGDLPRPRFSTQI